MKLLNIGCGEFPAPSPWVNMDITSNDQVQPNLIGSLLDLPHEVQGLERVYLGHVLEHLPREAIPSALEQLWKRCRPGAMAAAVGPDVIKAWELVITGQLDQETAIEAATGGCRWPGDKHLWACTEQEMVSMFRISGIKLASTVWIGSRQLDPFPVTSRAEWQCAVIGQVF